MKKENKVSRMAIEKAELRRKMRMCLFATYVGKSSRSMDSMLTFKTAKINRLSVTDVGRA